MKEHKQEIDVIINNPEEPTFENTIAALEYGGMRLSEVVKIFFALSSANTSPELQALAQRIAPMLSSHSDDIYLNPNLFKRVKAIYEVKETLDLSLEQKRVLDKIYDGFVRGGANLPEEKQARFREINEKLSTLTLKFGDNVLAETNSFKLVIDNPDDLAGLPEPLIAATAEKAKSEGLEGKWVFTLHNPSWIPFLQYSEKRELREKIYRAYFMRGNNGNEYDNKEIIKEIVPLRIERAQLLGYPTHAHFILENNMARTPDKVIQFLEELWDPALNRAKVEAYDIQKMIVKEEHEFRLES